MGVGGITCKSVELARHCHGSPGSGKISRVCVRGIWCCDRHCERTMANVQQHANRRDTNNRGITAQEETYLDARLSR